MNRRELLKHFGVGALIAPIAAPEIQARLVQVPEIDIATPQPTLYNPLLGPARMTLDFGSVMCTANVYILQTKINAVIDVTSSELAPGHSKMPVLIDAKITMAVSGPVTFR